MVSTRKAFMSGIQFLSCRTHTSDFLVNYQLLVNNGWESGLLSLSIVFLVLVPSSPGSKSTCYYYSRQDVVFIKSYTVRGLFSPFTWPSGLFSYLLIL